MQDGIADLTLTGRNGAEATFDLTQGGGVEIGIDDGNTAVVALGEYSADRVAALLAARPGRAVLAAEDFISRATAFVAVEPQVSGIWYALQVGHLSASVPAILRAVRAGRLGEAVAELVEAEKVLAAKMPVSPPAIDLAEDIQTVTGRAMNAPLQPVADPVAILVCDEEAEAA